MDVQEKNKEIRAAFHAAGIKGKGITFAVFDSGVKPVSWLKGKVTAAMKGADDDTNGHGTFVAGQLIEWCPDAEILSYNILKTGRCSPADLNEALEEFIDHVKDNPGQYIVNMSLSGDYAPDLPQIIDFEALLEELVGMNIPVVVAAGNDGEEALNKYPSCFQCPICVSALQQNGKRASFSTWHDEVDFAEHGVSVKGLGLRDNTTVTKSGTSMACPNLAGKLGLYMSMVKEQTGKWPTEEAAYEALKAAAVDMGESGIDPYFGWGFIELAPREAEKAPEEPAKEKLPGVSAAGLCAWCEKQLGQIYVWGGNGQEATPAKIKSMETSETNINRAMALYEKRLAEGLDPILMYDCSGLISRYLQNNGIVERKRNCDHLADMCSFVRTSRSDGEMVPGDLVFRWKSGSEAYYHVGVYVGAGKVIESKGRDDGVVKRDINASGSSYWNRWGRLAVFAGEQPVTPPKPAEPTVLKVTTPYMRGDAIKQLQNALNGLGYPAGDADGIYGPKSDAAVHAFVQAHGGTLPGKVKAYITIGNREYTGELEG